MFDIFKLETTLMTPLIKFILKHPGVMESKLFLKVMVVFPERISKTYDAMIEKSGIDYQAALTEGLLRISNNPKKILDLCTGTGFAAFMAAKHFPGATVDAIDQSNGMIEIAQKKAYESGVNNIQFKLGNALKLDYADKTFDLIVTSNAPVYLAEAARVLKAGALMLVSYSFGGEAFVKAQKNISNYLEGNGLKLLEVKSIGSGAYVLGEKDNKNSK
jgi:ubiquinone/menaquinone biosynthesis C-methylase UbiE